MRFYHLWFVVLLAALQAAVADEAPKVVTVKMSSSKICHSSDSQYYSRVKNYTAFEDLTSCLANGGRLPKIKTNTDKQAGYDRERWYHWEDADSDCQNTRAEVLIRQSRVTVTFASNQTCRVTSGEWRDPYSGNILTDANDLDIDHIVPLKWAYLHGAADWSETEKRVFANDMENLVAVTDQLNQSKRAKGPDQWMPPNSAYHCRYLQRFSGLVAKYQLRFTASEAAVVVQVLQSCNAI